MRPLSDILLQLDAFQPPPGSDIDWAPLETLVDELVQRPEPALDAIGSLLRVLDRFHSYGGFPVFWSIVHGIERLPGYEAALVSSLHRDPTRSGVTLLLRVLADGIDHVEGVAIAPLAAALMDHDPPARLP